MAKSRIGEKCPVCDKGSLYVYDHSMYKGSKCEHMIQMASDDKNRKASPYKYDKDWEEEDDEYYEYEEDDEDEY